MDIIIFTTTVFRLSALVLFLIGILPRMLREARIGNGLGFLRKTILTITFIYVVLEFFSVSVLFTNTGDVLPIINHINQFPYFRFLSIIRSIGTFLIALALYLIYTKDYGRLKKYDKSEKGYE